MVSKRLTYKDLAKIGSCGVAIAEGKEMVADAIMENHEWVVLVSGGSLWRIIDLGIGSSEIKYCWWMLISGWDQQQCNKGSKKKQENMIPCKPSEPRQQPVTIMIVALLKFWMPSPLLLNELAITPTFTPLVDLQLYPPILIVALKKSCVPSLSLLNDFSMAPCPILSLPETSDIKRLVWELQRLEQLASEYSHIKQCL